VGMKEEVNSKRRKKKGCILDLWVVEIEVVGS